MMVKEITYADAGVDRKLREKAKKAVAGFIKTYAFSRKGKVIKLPYNAIYPVGARRYQDHVIEGIGTKVLLAQIANKFDTIGIDAVAMAVNDVIRSGARPISLANNIDVQFSEPKLIGELKKGILEGVKQAEVIVPSGEIADVKDLIKGVGDKAFHIVCSCIGEVEENNIIWGNNLKPEDSIIGFESSGLHSNGISLARKILFKTWGGKYNAFDIPDSFDKEIVYEVLNPTKIYVKEFLKIAKEFDIKAAIHITGDAYLKFEKLFPFNPKIGFNFNNFNNLKIFELLQNTARELGKKITDEEMFKTFNMGWGFAIVVDKKDKDDILDRAKAEEIGHVTNSHGINVIYKGRKIKLE